MKKIEGIDYKSQQNVRRWKQYRRTEKIDPEPNMPSFRFDQETDGLLSHRFTSLT